MTTSRTVQWLIPSELAIPPNLTHDNHSAIEFLYHSVKLQEHIANIVNNLYGEGTDHDIGTSSPWPRASKEVPKPLSQIQHIDIGNFVSIEAAMVSWESELPDSLRVSCLTAFRENPEERRDISRQSIVLRAQ